MAKTPDQLTQEHYRNLGYHIVKVEGWVMYPKMRKKDFLGIYDYLAFNDIGDMIAIQTTTKHNMSARRKKMLRKGSFAWWTRGGRRSVLHGWYKNKSNRWDLQEEELTLEDWEKYQETEKAKYDKVDKTSPLYIELFGKE